MTAPQLRRRAAHRRGATLVEVALLLGIFLMFLFGIFEYGRYLMVLHVATNAARDGARYASVNVARASDFNTTDAGLSDSLGNPLISIEEFTRQRMGGLDRMLGDDFSVSVFACENAPMYADPPVFTPKLATAELPDPHWNSAQFTERIAVQIHGNYRPLLPTFLLMPDTIEVRITAAITSEG